MMPTWPQRNKGGISRKRSKNTTNGSYTRFWSVYVLRNEYHGNVVANILEYNRKYQDFLKAQKKQGLEIIGYARKSTCKTNEAVRMRLLEKMVKNLQDRSCVQKVFVLTSSNAHQSIKKRDRNGKIVEKTDGTTQDLLQYLKTTKKRVILVVLDYAGLTTNTEDLRDFLREYTNVVQIIVDRLPVTTEVEIFNTKLLLEDREAIKRFDCRTPPVHRSA